MGIKSWGLLLALFFLIAADWNLNIYERLFFTLSQISALFVPSLAHEPKRWKRKEEKQNNGYFFLCP
jgi:hypothetical protein